MLTSKQPVTINTPFKCEVCGKANPKADKTCRNHCRYCLYSKHVDKDTPGDRAGNCGGMMEPTHIDYRAKKGYQIIHKCKICGQTRTNKMAEDDNIEVINKLIARQNHERVSESTSSSVNKSFASAKHHKK